MTETDWARLARARRSTPVGTEQTHKENFGLLFPRAYRFKSLPITEAYRKHSSVEAKCSWCNMSNTKYRVQPHFRTPRKSWKWLCPGVRVHRGNNHCAPFFYEPLFSCLSLLGLLYRFSWTGTPGQNPESTTRRVVVYFWPTSGVWKCGETRSVVFDISFQSKLKLRYKRETKCSMLIKITHQTLSRSWFPLVKLD